MNPNRRPRQLTIVTGTGTGVGKTWVAAAIIDQALGHGCTVAARKPAQSFDPDVPDLTDADVLARACACEPHEVCPPHRSYEIPMAPPMAAAELGRPVPTMADLVAEMSWPDTDIGVVETAGGVRSPLAIDGDTVDLAAAIGPDSIVVVADAELGTINLVRLSTQALADWPTLVLLNRFDAESKLHLSNLAWLAGHDGLRVTTSIDTAAEFVIGK